MRGVAPGALFISHGAPTVLLENDAYAAALKKFAAATAPPAAIVVVSAHWLSGAEIGITSCTVNHAVYDFRGFPRELYAMKYPAPGSPPLAEKTRGLLSSAGFRAALDETRGLDHGAWVPLKLMYPLADVPVVQVSMPYPAPPETVLTMGKALAPLRAENVLLVGSGSMTHNLGGLRWGEKDAAPEAAYAAFERWVMERVAADDGEALLRFASTAPNAALAHPEDDHFLPLFFTLGCRREGDGMETLFRGFHYATLSMDTFAFLPGAPESL